MKKILSVLLVLVVLMAAAAGWAYSQREAFISRKIRDGIFSITGTGVALKGVHVEKRRVSVEQITILNPPGFKIPVLAIWTNAEIVLDPWALLRSRWKIESASAVLQKAAVQYAADGHFNLEKIPALHQAAQRPFPNFYIKRLELKLERMVYLDFRGPSPLRENYNFNNQVEAYDHVVSPEVLIQGPVLRFLEKANKGSLGFARGKIQESIANNTGKT